VLRPSALSYQIAVHHSSVIDIRDVIYLVAKRWAAPSQDWRLARGAPPKLLADRLALPPRKFCDRPIPIRSSGGGKAHPILEGHPSGRL
jgi:hypothetical protein